MNIVGFSRGGTHIFWAFFSSHPDLLSRGLEINDLFGRNALGIYKKLYIEARIFMGSSFALPFEVKSAVVEKAVCSWWNGTLFHFLRRHDPMKYISASGLREHQTIFLVKSPEEQYVSWSKRGCDASTFCKAYTEHLNNWTNYAKRNAAVFVRYEDFQNDPITITTKLWQRVGLTTADFPEFISVKPKKSKHNPQFPEANNTADRVWVQQRTDTLVSSLRDDVSAVEINFPLLKELYESIDYFS